MAFEAKIKRLLKKYPISRVSVNKATKYLFIFESAISPAPFMKDYNF